MKEQSKITHAHNFIAYKKVTILSVVDFIDGVLKK